MADESRTNLIWLERDGEGTEFGREVQGVRDGNGKQAGYGGLHEASVLRVY
jgi:hypothetical protein